MGKYFFSSFSVANAKRLYHYIILPVVDDFPNAVISHVVTNYIFNNANFKEIANSIAKIGLNCRIYGVNKIFISPILVKNPDIECNHNVSK